MKFSLIIATFGRKRELDALLISLRNQTYSDFEVIVVDQNPPEFLHEVRLRHEHAFQRLVWRHLDLKAANPARNIGLDEAIGDVVSFVDDDCEYRPDTLSTVKELLKCYPECGVLTGKSVDKLSGKDSMSRWPSGEVNVGFKNVLNLSLEFTTFFRRETLEFEHLDPEFGPGTKFGSREGPDLILRLLYRRVSVLFSSRICLFHPEKFTDVNDVAFLNRTQIYEQGFGALVAKHVKINASHNAIMILLWNMFVMVAFGLVKNLLLFRLHKINFWILILRSRLKGYRTYNSAGLHC